MPMGFYDLVPKDTSHAGDRNAQIVDLFSAAPSMHGYAFLLDSDSERQAYMRRNLEHRSQFYSEDSVLHFRSVLTRREKHGAAW